MEKRYIVYAGDSTGLGKFGPFEKLQTAEQAVLEMIKAEFEFARIEIVEVDENYRVINEAKDFDESTNN